MSEQLTNIIKILLITFILLFYHGMEQPEKQQPYNYLSMNNLSSFSDSFYNGMSTKVKLSIRNNEKSKS